MDRQVHMSDTDDLKTTIKAALKVLDEENPTLTNHADRYHFAVPGILFGIMGQLERIADALPGTDHDGRAEAYKKGWQAGYRAPREDDIDAILDQPFDLGGEPDAKD